MTLRPIRLLVGAALSLALAACGTTYSMPGIADETNSRASTMFAEAKTAAPRSPISESAGVNRFARVSRRIEPVARQLCETELAQGKAVDCDVKLELDREMQQRNAYFTYAEAGNRSPVIRFSVPLLQDTGNDDEVAFIMGHEYGHLIGRHIQKGQQQAIAGALILGVITAAASAQGGGYYDQTAVENSMELGAMVGQRAYSQTYELESDMLGTRIAHAAGYDPVKGAQFFARDEAARSGGGQLSFWGTHPPDEKRMAMVLATMEQIQGQQALTRKASQ